jgi:hypothetical protein
MAVTAMLGAAACQSLSMRPPHWRVDVSALDYVQFYYSPDPLAEKGQFGNVIYVELQGSGYLTYRAGTSPRVSDEFWQDRQSAHWDEMSHDTIMISQQAAQAVFQRLVDIGYFEEETFRFRKQEPPKDGIFVLASITNRKKADYTGDPRVRDLLRALLQQF